MRIAVVGAGAIGSLLAARLSVRGHDVVLVGRPAHVAAIETRGLLVREPGGATTRYHLRVTESLLERPDLVLLTVKSQDVARACHEMLPVARGVPIVTLQNGVRSDRLAADVLGEDVVVGGVVMIAASYLEPGEVTLQFSGWMLIGEPFGPVTQRTRDIARVLGEVAPTYVTPRLRSSRWSKLVSNLNNGLCAATGLTLPDLAHSAEGRLLSVRVMKEGVAVARALDIALDHGMYGLSPAGIRQNPNAAFIAVLQSTLTSVLSGLPEALATGVLQVAGRSRLNALPIRGSTWQSIARGSPSEIDYLNGEIVAQGTEVGVPTPYNARIVEVVHAVAADRRFRSLGELFPSAVRESTGIAVGSSEP